jgi:hypothetical protein
MAVIYVKVATQRWQACLMDFPKTMNLINWRRNKGEKSLPRTQRSQLSEGGGNEGLEAEMDGEFNYQENWS